MEPEAPPDACRGLAGAGGASSSTAAADAADADAAAGPRLDGAEAAEYICHVGRCGRAKRAKLLDLDKCLTQFLFDWDDTLLPTSALFVSPQLTELPASTRKILRRIDTEAALLLNEALSLPGETHVMVLTNATTSWVHTMAKEHLPRVCALLEGQGGRVVLKSARPDDLTVPPSPSSLCGQEDAKEEEQEEDAEEEEEEEDEEEDGDADAMGHFAEWKNDAVRPMAETLQRAVDELGGRIVQIVSIGDMVHDLEAARVLAGQLCVPELYVKTVRMFARPSMTELAAEIRTVRQELLPLCRRRRDLNTAVRNLRAPPPPQPGAAPAGPQAARRHGVRSGAAACARAHVRVCRFARRRPAARAELRENS